jgi:5-methylthioadenosine/S-adenosylhomocysteine deaminase
VSAGPAGASLLIHDALVVPGDGHSAPFEGWVEIAGSRIRAVGTGRPPEVPGARRIDARGHALLPGLVNTHAHSHSSLTRGTAEGLALDGWIATIEREQARLSEEDAYAAALATYGEALLSGATTLLDMCLRPAAAMRAARALGLRVVIAPYVLERSAFAPRLAEVRELLARRESEPREDDERVGLWVGLHDLEGCSDALIAEGAALARAHGTGLHLHCAETRAAVERTRSRTGRTPIAQLDALGALGPRTLLAHCVWADAEDRALLAARGTSVAHCPHANLKLASGFAPVPALQQAGARVVLATDGAKANNRLDMFDVMKFASLIHKGQLLDAGVLPAPAVLRMATGDGAAALGIEAGTIEAGRLADLVLVDLQQFHLQPALPSTIETNLVHAARGADVRTVLVGGELVVEHGRLVRMDQSGIVASMRGAAERLMAVA